MDLYRYVPPPGENIPISVDPFPVNDLVTTEDKIEWAVTCLQNHRSGGPSGMRDKHPKGWLAETREKKREEAATDQETPIEGTIAGPHRTGREETEEIQEKTPAETYNWERVVDLVHMSFREGRLTGENTW